MKKEILEQTENLNSKLQKFNESRVLDDIFKNVKAKVFGELMQSTKGVEQKTAASLIGVSVGMAVKSGIEAGFKDFARQYDLDPDTYDTIILHIEDELKS